jgi:hypothetical protein
VSYTILPSGNFSGKRKNAWQRPESPGNATQRIATPFKEHVMNVIYMLLAAYRPVA